MVLNPYAAASRSGYINPTTLRYGYQGAKYIYRGGKWAAKRYRESKPAKKRDVKREIKKAKGPSSRVTTRSVVPRTAGELYSFQVGSDIKQGTDITDRIGQGVCIRGLHIRYDAFNTSATEHRWVRMMLLKVKDSDPISQEFFKGINNSRGEDFPTATDPSKIRRPVNRKRFIVLWQHRMLLAANSLAAPTNPTNDFGKHQKLGSHLVKFNEVQLTFESRDTTVEGPKDIRPRYEFVYWFEKPSVGSASSDVTIDIDFTTYFCHQ